MCFYLSNNLCNNKFNNFSQFNNLISFSNNFIKQIINQFPFIYRALTENQEQHLSEVVEIYQKQNQLLPSGSLPEDGMALGLKIKKFKINKKQKQQLKLSKGLDLFIEQGMSDSDEESKSGQGIQISRNDQRRISKAVGAVTNQSGALSADERRRAPLFASIKIGHHYVAGYIDTGAQATVMSLDQFRRLPSDLREKAQYVNRAMSAANGSPIKVMFKCYWDITIGDQLCKRWPVFIVDHLIYPFIIGVDLLVRSALCIHLDPKGVSS